jgi:Putative neutral zinc metallopeptidase
MSRLTLIAVAAFVFLFSPTAAFAKVDARPSAVGTLYNPQQVADATFPALNAFWRASFAAGGLTWAVPPHYYWYNKPGLRWFRAPLACDTFGRRDGWMWGGRSARYRPNSYFCPSNDSFYLDWNFLQVLGFRRTRQWGPGRDARVALVIAHEFGHHVQHLLRTPEQKRAQGQYANYELEADCFAGVFFHRGEDINLMERGDTLSAAVFLGYLGDPDRTPWYEPDAHGSHSDRQEWFNYGYSRYSPSDCARVFR